jgi:Replication-relaxation
MTAAADWSGRRSDRVEPRSVILPGQLAMLAINAPESMAIAVGSAGTARRSPVAPERTGKRQLRQLGNDLSERDRAILQSLADFHFQTGAQLQALHFPDHRTPQAAARLCRRALARLASHRLLEHLDRRIGGLRAGSDGYVWRLGSVGDRLLRQDAEDETRLRRKAPSIRYLDHCLAVADCYLQLVAGQRRDAIELVAVETEPACWRRFHGVGGSREILKPDLYAVTAVGEYEDHWFWEIDRATESLPTILRKCAQYERYRRSGKAQADGGVFPWVVWIVPDERRRQRLRDGIRHSRQLDNELFRVITADKLPGLVRGGSS